MRPYPKFWVVVVGVQELDDVLVLQLVQDLNLDHEVGQLLLRLKAQVDFFQFRYSVYLQTTRCHENIEIFKIFNHKN